MGVYWGFPMNMTRDLQLHYGRSPWMGPGTVAIPFSPMTRDRKADVVIVGAGISGAMIGDALTEDGHEVIILDGRKPASGSTAASTALLQYEIDTPLSTLSKQIGLERAQRVWRRSRLALSALRERQCRLGIDADCRVRESLYLEGNVLDASELEAEARARQRAGLEVRFMSRSAVRDEYGISKRAGILGYNNLSANPRRLAAGFLAAACARGAKIFSPALLQDVETDNSGVVAKTHQGPQIRARHLVFATGYEIPVGVPRKNHSITSTWAMATAPQPRALWPTGCMIWEASDPYLYLRPTADGRVICGGEDEPFENESLRNQLLDSKTHTLQRKLRQMFPSLKVEAEFRWCGSFGASSTGMPSIGRVPGMPNCYAVLGYGGNGITFSMIGAQIIRTQLRGERDPDAHLFSFWR